MQHELALAADAATVIYTALTDVVRHSRSAFHSTSRNGAVYANTTENIDCDAEPLQPWRHGYDVMKALREVSKILYQRTDVSRLTQVALVSIRDCMIVTHRFCRAMLCKRGLCHHAVSVCPSIRLSVRPSRSYILSKRIMIPSKFLVATTF